MHIRTKLGVFVVLIVSAVSFYMSNEKNKFNLKLSINGERFDSSILVDPANILSLDHATLAFNLFAPLLSYNNDGSITPVLAKKWEISGSSVFFYLNENAKTSSGNKITSAMVIKSFKRLIILGTGTHGSFKHFIECSRIKKIGDSCENIKAIDDSTIKFTLKKEQYIKFFIPIGSI
jgi:ABC-type transport system substrate-binding protein